MAGKLLGKETSIKLNVLKLGVNVNTNLVLFLKVKGYVSLAIDKSLSQIHQPLRRIPSTIEDTDFSLIWKWSLNLKMVAKIPTLYCNIWIPRDKTISLDNKSFSEVERWYSKMKKKIATCSDRWKTLLLLRGTKFELATKHKPLEAITISGTVTV